MTEVGPFLATPEDFRRHGRETVDWVADYLSNLESYPVLARTAPGRDRGDAPAVCTRASRVFRARSSPISTASCCPEPRIGSRRAFSPTSPPTLRRRRFSETWSQPASVSTACSGRRARPVPRSRRSCSTGSSICSGCRRGSDPRGWAAESSRTAPRRPRCARCSRPANGRLEPAAPSRLSASTPRRRRTRRFAREPGSPGFSPGLLRLVEVDDNFAMDPAALAAAVRSDREAGLVPCCVVATAGTTSSMAFDPIRAIGELCEAEGVWLHVDAAMAGSAAVCPELQVAARRASSSRTATPSTRTSGCSQTSTATASTSPIGRASPTPSR